MIGGMMIMKIDGKLVCPCSKEYFAIKDSIKTLSQSLATQHSKMIIHTIIELRYRLAKIKYLCGGDWAYALIGWERNEYNNNLYSPCHRKELIPQLDNL